MITFVGGGPNSRRGVQIRGESMTASGFGPGGPNPGGSKSARTPARQRRGSDEVVEETQAAPPKKKTLREATLEVQTAHKEMCEQAKSSMAIMNEVMKKLHSKLDELYDK